MRPKSKHYYGFNSDDRCCMVAWAEDEGNGTKRFGNASARQSLVAQTNKFGRHECRSGVKGLSTACHICPRDGYHNHDKLQAKYTRTPTGDEYSRDFDVDGAANTLLFCGMTAYLFDFGFLKLLTQPFGTGINHDSGILRIEFTFAPLSEKNGVKLPKFLSFADLINLREELHGRLIAWPNRNVRPYYRALGYRLASMTRNEESIGAQYADKSTPLSSFLQLSLKTSIGDTDEKKESDSELTIHSQHTSNRSMGSCQIPRNRFVCTQKSSVKSYPR